MGQLLYGTKVDAEIEDRSLFHLDVLLARLGGAAFQLHFMPGGKDDGSLVSLSIAPGTPLTLVYGNHSDLSLDIEVIQAAELAVSERAFVTIPFTFQSDLSEVRDA